MKHKITVAEQFKFCQEALVKTSASCYILLMETLTASTAVIETREAYINRKGAYSPRHNFDILKSLTDNTKDRQFIQWDY